MARLNIRAALADADEQFVMACSLHRKVLSLLYDGHVELTQCEEIELHMRVIQLRKTIENTMIEQNLLRAEHEEYE